MHSGKSGFSLVELSIVLVILGLLVGGILAGRSLIRASELRNITTSIDRYRTAVYSFRDKYFALPGDMTNATSFWGIRAGTGSDVTCHQTISTYTGTCNGDGNAQINYITGDSASLGERFLPWQHLAYAGLIEGSYTGASGNSASYVRVAGTNLPKAAGGTNYFEFAWLGGPVSGNAQYFDGSYNYNILTLLSNTYPLRPEEVWNIDTKFDDGKPATGNMFVFKNTSSWEPNCATTDVVTTAVYDFTNSNFVCYLMIAIR